jgi:putative salt-induced outer membrane protein
MKVTVFFASLLSALPLSAAFATDAPPPPPQGWSGSGEAGLAASSGNTRTENLNAKVSVKFNDGAWKNEFYAQALRSENTVTATVTDTGSNPPTQVSTTKYELTALRPATSSTSAATWSARHATNTISFRRTTTSRSVRSVTVTSW